MGRTKQWLVFKDISNLHPVRTTMTWMINSNHGEPLGIIQWYAPWRKYCFFPIGNTIWDMACLAEITQFMTTQMAAKRKQHGYEVSARVV
jgi:hypothetical protein